METKKFTQQDKNMINKHEKIKNEEKWFLTFNDSYFFFVQGQNPAWAFIFQLGF
jgi:hypothetical protein